MDHSSGELQRRLHRVSPPPSSRTGPTILEIYPEYLYLDDGAKTLDRERLVASRPYLTPAELIVVRWLHTRSNGSERKNYGPDCVVSAKKTRYRCNRCKFPDVRVLQLDHVNGRGEGVKREFECLCANCHMVKSRENDWSKPS